MLRAARRPSPGRRYVVPGVLVVGLATPLVGDRAQGSPAPDPPSAQQSAPAPVEPASTPPAEPIVPAPVETPAPVAIEEPTPRPGFGNPIQAPAPPRPRREKVRPKHATLASTVAVGRARELLRRAAARRARRARQQAIEAYDAVRGGVKDPFIPPWMASDGD